MEYTRQKKEKADWKEDRKNGDEGETYELVYPMTIYWVRAALVVADDLAAHLLVVVVVGIRACNDHASVRALSSQARTRLR